LGESVFANLVRRIESGQIQPLVAQTFPLEQIREAQALFETRAHIGKLVIEVGKSG
jgi:NADPH:quinone reductase-like Zn-dependent oxidoreductase